MMKDRESSFLSVPGPGDRVSSRIMSRIASDPHFMAADTVLAYMAIPGEVPLDTAFRDWMEAGKRIILPVVDGEGLILRQYDPGCLTPGYRGIMEPSAASPSVNPSEIRFALVPGVAFTPDGMRLGRGKGFYDRLLPQLDCPKAGVCFPFRILPELPADPWDARLDEVITANPDE